MRKVAVHVALDDLVRKWSCDESRRKAIEDARRWAADALASEAGEARKTARSKTVGGSRRRTKST